MNSTAFVQNYICINHPVVFVLLCCCPCYLDNSSRTCPLDGGFRTSDRWGYVYWVVHIKRILCVNHVECVVNAPSSMIIPEIEPERRCGTPPVCFKRDACLRWNTIIASHNHPTVARTVSRKCSPNIGRKFYACVWPEGRRCSFFRWHDELSQFSEMQLRDTLSLSDLQRETMAVDIEKQRRAWGALQQAVTQSILQESEDMCMRVL